MSFQSHNLYPPDVLPRVELKFKAKDLLRGNWLVLIGVTLLVLLLTGFQVNYTYQDESITNMHNASTGELVASYFDSSPLSSIGSALGNLGVGGMIAVTLIAIVTALLIGGVLNYCYTAWFVTLSEIGHSRPLTFGDFAAHFRNGVAAVLAYIWQQLWTLIWSLLGLPGFLLMAFQVAQVSGSQEAFAASLATGGMSVGLGVGSVLYLAGLIAVYIITLRYTFIYQVLADGRGKVGPRQALRYSCILCKGHLKEIFLLVMSFIPWYLLSIFSFGLAFFYVYPYVNATMAQAYRWLRDKAFADGRLDPAALGYKKAGEATNASEVAIVGEA